MKIAILHHTFRSWGGGERVSLTLIKAINENNIVPDLYTVSPVDLNFIKKFFGEGVKANTYTIIPIKLNLFGIYQRLFQSIILPKLEKYDLVINTTGVYTPLYKHETLKRYILYIYNPQIWDMPEKYTESTFWKLYYQPYRSIINNSIKKLDGIELLSVSKFTKLRIEKYWGYQSRVIYPPVNIKEFTQVSDNIDRDGVITIGRFTPEKNHLHQLEIAKKLPHIRFRICGSTGTTMYYKWYQYIKAKAEEMNLKNIEFHPNIPFKKLLDLVSQSKIFLHTFPREDFGIVSIEAEAGGCIPIVPNQGGNIETVPTPDLRYNTHEEAVQKIKRYHNLTGEEYHKLRNRLKQHAQQFTEETFKKNIIKMIGL